MPMRQQWPAQCTGTRVTHRKLPVLQANVAACHALSLSVALIYA